MNIDWSKDELCDLLDCIGNRMDDLQDCAMFGDAIAIEDEIERMQDLNDKVANALDTMTNGESLHG